MKTRTLESRRGRWVAGLAGLWLTTLCPPAAAGELSARELGDLSLDELMNETVTSVSKKEENLFNAAAAVSVLSNDDLRRSGVTTVADALRLVPGMSVGSVNASQWAISARGFNNLYANKLLVLVDGRAVYTPLFAGVYWDLQAPMLADVDRIEVIRGPGATVWGANAVNGVINIVTRSAADTQGTLVYAGGGDVHQANGGMRYGGSMGSGTHYRAFVDYQRTAGFPLANGQDASDRWQSGHGGFRFDRELQPGSRLTWQTDATLSDLDDGSADGSNINTLGRWTRQLSGGSNLEVQAYFDHTKRKEPARSNNTTDTSDLTLQHSFGLGPRHDLIWGLGYRYIAGTLEQSNSFAQVRDDSFHQQVFSAFVQNQFKLVPDRLNVTAGVKLEHNDYTGLEIQPSLRASFTLDARQTLWSAVSRAVRTPSVIEGKDVFAIALGAPIMGPDGGLFVPTLVANPSVKSEVLWAWELGYRVRPVDRVSVDLASFYNRYSDLAVAGGTPNFVPGEPVGSAELTWQNAGGAKTWGAETSVTWAAMDFWRLTTAYSLLVIHLQNTGSILPDTATNNSPQHQASLRSAYDFSRRGSVNAQLRYVDAIKDVAAYLTADLHLSYRPLEQLELSLVGQNLLDSQHLEQPVQILAISSEVPRGIYGKLAWSFR